MAEIELGTLYDINKELMKNEPVLDPILFNKKIAEIAEIMKDKSEYEDKHYWMLLCHDRRDYTLFNIISAEENYDIEFELGPTLRNRGKILSIAKQNDNTNSWEIWIQDDFSNENFAYFLFEYDDAVIEINE